PPTGHERVFCRPSCPDRLLRRCQPPRPARQLTLSTKMRLLPPRRTGTLGSRADRIHASPSTNRGHAGSTATRHETCARVVTKLLGGSSRDAVWARKGGTWHLLPLRQQQPSSSG